MRFGLPQNLWSYVCESLERESQHLYRTVVHFTASLQMPSINIRF